MSASPICSICCEKFTVDCGVMTTTCGHLFHRDCIGRWMSSNNSCPECRRSHPSLSRVYLNFEETTASSMSVNESSGRGFQTNEEELLERLEVAEMSINDYEKEVSDLKKLLEESQRKCEETQHSLEDCKRKLTLQKWNGAQHPIEVLSIEDIDLPTARNNNRYDFARCSNPSHNHFPHLNELSDTELLFNLRFGN